MREGHVVYHGERSQIVPYLNSIGLEVPEDQDLADFLNDFLTHPPTVLSKLLRNRKKEIARAKRALQADVSLSEPEDALRMVPIASDSSAKHVPLTTFALVERWKESQLYSILKKKIEESKNLPAWEVSKWSSFTKACFAQAYSHSFGKHLRSLSKRQATFQV